MNVERDFVFCDTFVGEVADEVSGDGAAEFPTVFFCQ